MGDEFAEMNADGWLYGAYPLVTMPHRAHDGIRALVAQASERGVSSTGQETREVFGEKGEKQR